MASRFCFVGAMVRLLQLAIRSQPLFIARFADILVIDDVDGSYLALVSAHILCHIRAAVGRSGK